jgi:hypothetical protein
MTRSSSLFAQHADAVQFSDHFGGESIDPKDRPANARWFEVKGLLRASRCLDPPRYRQQDATMLDVM